ncbi:hypothetical protein AB1Y20_019566 [Prymnesium parvum]|uniref:Receptor ligand binding region domain-containing protein n=1 Tax=Prymnesium parvum TaxID=97485 RepID=A0AB34JVF9_PRYPA
MPSLSISDPDYVELSISWAIGFGDFICDALNTWARMMQTCMAALVELPRKRSQVSLADSRGRGLPPRRQRRVRLQVSAFLAIATLASQLVGAQASGYALTFDGQGTDVATVQLPPEVFRGARGITFSTWARSFGLYGVTQCLGISFLTPVSSNWLQPLNWRDSGDILAHNFFDTSVPVLDPAYGLDHFLEWRHLAVTWDEQGDLNTYVDGVRVNSASAIKSGYNITANTAQGVYLALGIYASSATTNIPSYSLRGSLDQVQLWTHALDAQQVEADYRTLGQSDTLPEPVLRYTFDEGGGETAANSGSAANADLRLGQSPDDSRYFFANGATFEYTSPVWGPSILPLNVSTLAPIVRTFKAGRESNFSLHIPGSALSIRLLSVPSHGQLRLDGTPLYAGAVVPSSALLSYNSSVDGLSAFVNFSFEILGSGAAASSGDVHLLEEGPPEVVPGSASCEWPRGKVVCTPEPLTMQEDTPQVLFLLGRSARGSARTMAVVATAPKHGTLYQMTKCCDPVAGRGSVIRDGDVVLNGRSAVVFIPAENSFGTAADSLTYYVTDWSGEASELATLVMDVLSAEDAPLLELSDVVTPPLTPVFVPLRASDAEGDFITFALEGGAAYGKVFLDDNGKPGDLLSGFSGRSASSNLIQQYAIDVLKVSSHWPAGVQWHPLQVVGPRDVFQYGDSTLAWSPRLIDGDSGNTVLSDSDLFNVTVRNVTRRLSFVYNPTELYERYGYTEFIEVKFATALYPASVVIGENRGMCSVVRILGRSSEHNNEFVELWRAKDRLAGQDGLLETAVDRSECWQRHVDAERYRIFTADICRQPLKVDVLRIELDTRSVSDWNELDFIELVGSTVLQDGVVPASSSGIWYVPDPGFDATDTLSIVAYDCPFDQLRRSQTATVRITVDGYFPPLSPPPKFLIPEVNIGVLLPKFGANGDPVPWSPRVGVYQAIQEINNKTDGVADGLLPGTLLRIANKDSQCDDTVGLMGALYLTRDAFGGNGVSAIIGAGCSGASISASQVAGFSNVPIISPTSTSPTLSDGIAFPYFLRAVASDAFLAVSLVELLQSLWGYTSIALVHSTDSYGSASIPDFTDFAKSRGIAIVATERFAPSSTDLSAQHVGLLQSSARIIVLYCSASDASYFLRTAFSMGLGGDGYLWLGPDSLATSELWESDYVLASNSSLRDLVLRGFFALVPTQQESTTYQDYLARRRKLPVFDANSTACVSTLDDDGALYFAGDNDNDEATPLRCAVLSSWEDNPYDTFAYDSVYAIAHSLHYLLSVQNRSEIVGSELLDTLVRTVRFEGASGIVNFFDASDDPDRKNHGDRRSGIAYALFNYVDSARGFVTVGLWKSCEASKSCAWSEQWHPTPGVQPTYSTADNKRPPQTGSCRRFEVLTAEGTCACQIGYERDAAQCIPCPPFTSSVGLESRCVVCAAGRYLPTGLTVSSDSCKACPDFATCPLNSTLETLHTQAGYWRLSPLTSRIYKCNLHDSELPNDNDTACVGGAPGACARGHAGPLCKICLEDNYYFKDSSCVECPDAGTGFGVLAFILATIFSIPGLLYCLHEQTNPKYVRVSAPLRKLVHEAKSYMKDVGLVPKLKLFLTFVQVLATLEVTYSIGLPPTWFRWTSVFRFLGDINWSSWAVPSSCFISDERDMLLFRGLIPLSIVVITPVVGAVRGATLFLLDIKEEPRECSKKQHRVRRKTVELAGWIGKKALVPPKNKDQLPTTWKQALTKGALNFLPLSLVIAFCFTPSVSAKTFSEWHCLSYVYDGETEYSYLANDLSVRCDDSDEYDDIISVAWLFIAVWPIGMVAMYIALLVPCRNLLRDEHVESPLLRATAFLHRDYKIGYFWWEVASLMQRTTLTGWLLLIDDKDGIFRLLAAQLICLSFLVVLLALQPYKRYMDNTIAAACQVVFICIFIGGALVRIYNSILDDFEGSPDLAYRTLGVSSSEYLVLIMLGVAFTMLGTLVLTLACESYMRANQLRLANRWSVCTMNPPSVKWKPDGIYAAFLSHYKNEAASDARYMHDMLRKMLKAPVFLDSSSLSDLRDLITEGVHKSDTLEYPSCVGADEQSSLDAGCSA